MENQPAPPTPFEQSLNSLAHRRSATRNGGGSISRNKHYGSGRNCECVRVVAHLDRLRNGLSPGQNSIHRDECKLHLAQVYIELGENDLALAALNDAGKLGVNSKIIAMRGYIFARAGRIEEANDVMNTLLSISQERYVPPYCMAMVHLGLGQFDTAMQWLERCFDARDVHVAFLPVDPKWDPMRGDPRFSALLRRCAIPQGSLPIRC